MYFMDYIRSHKLVLLGAAVALGCFVAFSVARCNYTTKARLEEAQGIDEKQSGTAEGSLQPTPKQSEILLHYKTGEKEFSLALASYTWVSQDGIVTVKFSQDGTYTVIRGGKEEKSGTFAISAVSGASISGDTTQASDDAAPTIASLIFEDDTTKILSIQRVARPGDDGIDLVMTTDAFGSKLSLTAKRMQEEISVEGISDEMKERLGEKETERILQALDEHVRKNYPSTTSITCRPIVILNYETKSVQLTFDLNDVRKSRLVLVWNKEDDTFSFTDGRSL